jgi:MFS family permease
MARLGRAADLLLPGAVSVVLVTPALSLGALAALMRADFPLGAGELGAMFALYFLCSAVSASAGGRFAARWSATRLVRAAVVCAALVCAVIALVPSKPVLIGGCVVAGAANGLAAPALNMLILWLIPSNRHGLAFGVRVAAAPGTSTLAALGAYAVASAGWHWPAFYWGAALLGGAVAALLGRAGRRDPGVTVVADGGPSRGPAPASLRLLTAGGLLGATASTVLAPFLVISLVDRGADAGRAAGLLAIGGWLVIGGRIAAGVVSDRVPRPFAHVRAVAWMLLACGAGMAVLAWAGSDAAVVVATLVAMGFGWSWPGLLHHAVISTHPDSPTRATSLMQTGTYLGSVAGPLAFGLAADRWSFSVAWTGSAVMAGGAALSLIAGVRRIEHRRR